MMKTETEEIHTLRTELTELERESLEAQLSEAQGEVTHGVTSSQMVDALCHQLAIVTCEWLSKVIELMPHMLETPTRVIRQDQLIEELIPVAVWYAQRYPLPTGTRDPYPVRQWVSGLAGSLRAVAPRKIRESSNRADGVPPEKIKICA